LFNYQSDKYTATTATSEMVTVTFATSNTFEVEQNTVKSFTVKFDAPVKAVGDVTVNRLYKGFELPTLVKKAELSKDGMSATVELYAALKDKEEYVINVAGYETYKLTASAGAPVDVLLYNNADNKYADVELVYLDGTTNLVDVNYRLIDARGVDVTEVVKANGTLFLTAETDEAGNYFVTDDKIWFSKAGLDVTVSAEFQMYDNEGNLLTPAKGEKTFVAEDKPAVEVLGLADWKVGGDWDKKQQSLPLDETSTIALKIKLSEKVGDNDWIEVLDDDDDVLGGTIRLEELNPEVAALDGFDVVYFKQGTAKILVYYCFTDASGNPDELPIAQLDIAAKPATKLASFTLDKASVNVGTVDTYDEGVVTVSAKNNHGGDCTGFTVEVEGTDDASKAAKTAGGAVAVGDKVYFYGSILKENNNNKAAAQMTFKIKVSKADYTGAVTTLEKNVTVVYKSRGEEGTEYIRVEAKDFGKDVARTAKDDTTKAEKVGVFSVYQYSNGIKVDTVDVQPYNADTITTGNYYFKVVKDGKDVTDKVSYAGNEVFVVFAGVNDEDNNAVTYDLGAGNYAISLYEVVSISGKPYARPVNGATAAGAVTCNTGSYSYAGRSDNETLNGSVDPADILAMFKFKNAQGGDTLATLYTVQANTDADNYVYVTSITFYDDLGDGTTAKYVVPIGMALKK